MHQGRLPVPSLRLPKWSQLLLSAAGRCAYCYIAVRDIFAGDEKLESERLFAGGWQRVSRQSADTDQLRTIWVHCASVGEFRGVQPVVCELIKRGEFRIILTTTSTTGRALAKESFAQAEVFLLPVDDIYLWRKVLRAVEPELFLIAETEIWPNMLRAIAEFEIPCLLFNARISDGTFKHYRKLKALLRPLFAVYQRILTASEVDRERYLELGAIDSQLVVNGSTKNDLAVPRYFESERKKRLEALGLSDEAPAIVAASVREGEFEQVIKAYNKLLATYPGTQLIIAPRHPEYFSDVASCLQLSGLNFQRCSAGPEILQRRRSGILLVDAIGQLRELFSLGEICFVGGSLVNIGGHNPLEPAAAGLAVLSGPYMQNVAELVDGMKGQEAIEIVESGEALAEAFERLLSDEGLLRERQEAASQFAESQQGAVEGVLEAAELLLESS